MSSAVNDLIYLLSCSVNSIVPDKKRLEQIDMDKLYQFSKMHTLRASVYVALKSAGVNNDKFFQAYNKAVRKNVLLDIERTAILSEFEQDGIWYLPLKGTLLKEIYPENGMREMADNDILYDSTKQKKVKEIMLAHGYSAEEVGKGYHDVYMKPPVLNFEFHTSLFDVDQPKEFRKVYSDPKQLMISDEDKKYGYHLSDEDFYVYMTAHEWEHFRTSGTGIRSLLDCYVYINKKGGTLDRDHIARQLKQLGLSEFEKKRRHLAMKLFSSPELPELSKEEDELLTQYTSFGTYGTIEHNAYNKINKYFSESKNESKAKYIFKCIFPPTEHMKMWFPFFYKHRFLLPLGYVWRWIRAVFTRKDRIKAILKVTRDYDKKENKAG